MASYVCGVVYFLHKGGEEKKVYTFISRGPSHISGREGGRRGKQIRHPMKKNRRIRHRRERAIFVRFIGVRTLSYTSDRKRGGRGTLPAKCQRKRSGTQKKKRLPFSLGAILFSMRGGGKKRIHPVLTRSKEEGDLILTRRLSHYAEEGNDDAPFAMVKLQHSGRRKGK